MPSIKMQVGLDLPSDGGAHRLDGIIAAAVSKVGCNPAPAAPEDTSFWSAKHFGLPGVRAYEALGEEQQQAVLRQAGRGLLEEAYFIEKAGMAYAAKMSLSARTTEERVLYSMIAGDEACHFSEVSSYLDITPDPQGNPFLALLTEMIETGDRDSLIFVIQVVLEGWGLTHYRAVAEGCRHPELATALHGILRDEARHHGSGMLLFDATSLSSKSERFIVEVMTRFLHMVRMGPQSVASAVIEASGGLSKRQRVELFSDLEAVDHSASRLSILRNLMVRAGAEPIIDALKDSGEFRPMSAQECAA